MHIAKHIAKHVLYVLQEHFIFLFSFRSSLGVLLHRKGEGNPFLV